MTRTRTRPRTSAARSREHGAVTAEAALVLPLIALVAMAMAWLVALGIVSVRAQDAAREAARVVARGESVDSGVRYAHQVAPPGSAVVVTTTGGTVRVVVTARVGGPGGLLGFIRGVEVHGRAVAATEEGAP